MKKIITKRSAPNRVNAEVMSPNDIRKKIRKGIDDVEAGRVHDLKTLTRKKMNNL